MKKYYYLFLFFLLSVNIIGNVTAQTRYAACDLCGFCPPNPAPKVGILSKMPLSKYLRTPQPWKALLLIRRPTSPCLRHQGNSLLFLGCLGASGGGFTNQGAAGGVIQSLLNIVFSMTGGIALSICYMERLSSPPPKPNPEKLNYGKRVVYGAIAGLVFTFGSVFIVKFIATGVLKIPDLGKVLPNLISFLLFLKKFPLSDLTLKWE